MVNPFFSILLPTRDRLELLRNAVETVRLQNYDNWEIIISDNASSQDITGYVKKLGDQRVRYIRSKMILPVTENWNRAHDYSNGELTYAWR
jgi:glycosyltransferase involved in cell wall biosynthesis